MLNILNLPGVDFVGDIKDLTQFADESIDEIYASHVLEHVSLPNMPRTLDGLYRVIKPGGRLLISVPDIDVLCQAMLDPALTSDDKFYVMQMIYGGQIDDFDYHYFGWNIIFMETWLKRAGFQGVEKVGHFGLFNDTSDYAPYGVPISLNVIATKAAPFRIKF